MWSGDYGVGLRTDYCGRGLKEFGVCPKILFFISHSRSWSCLEMSLPQVNSRAAQNLPAKQLKDAMVLLTNTNKQGFLCHWGPQHSFGSSS